VVDTVDVVDPVDVREAVAKNREIAATC